MLRRGSPRAAPPPAPAAPLPPKPTYTMDMDVEQIKSMMTLEEAMNLTISAARSKDGLSARQQPKSPAA